MAQGAPDSKGIALIAVIIIILITAIAVLGITSFISNALALTTVRASMEQAISAAQAGIYAAIYDYLLDPALPYWTKVTTPQNISGNIYYKVGKDANFLLVSAVAAQRSSRTLINIPLFNINETQSITVNKMKVEWSNFTSTLREIRMGGVSRWSGSSPSGTTITLSSPFTLSSKQFFARGNDNTWRFNNNIPAGAVIIATFIFDPPTGDGSSRKAVLWTSGAGRKNEFSVSATGEARGKIAWKRTVEATYDAGSGVITSWQETEGHL